MTRSAGPPYKSSLACRWCPDSVQISSGMYGWQGIYEGGGFLLKFSVEGGFTRMRSIKPRPNTGMDPFLFSSFDFVRVCSRSYFISAPLCYSWGSYLVFVFFRGIHRTPGAMMVGRGMDWLMGPRDVLLLVALGIHFTRYWSLQVLQSCDCVSNDLISVNAQRIGRIIALLSRKDEKVQLATRKGAVVKNIWINSVK